MMLTMHTTAFFLTHSQSQILSLGCLTKLILNARRTRRCIAIKGRCAMKQSEGLAYYLNKNKECSHSIVL